MIGQILMRELLREMASDPKEEIVLSFTFGMSDDEPKRRRNLEFLDEEGLAMWNGSGRGRSPR